MPGFDGTGPRGQGAMSGKGMGYCAVPVSDTSQPPVIAAQPLPATPLVPGYRNFLKRGGGVGVGRGSGRCRGRSGKRGGGRRWR